MELKGRDAMKVQALPGVHPYKQFLADGITESKMWKKEYRRFAYQGKAFVVESTHKFCTDFDNAKIYSVELVLEDDNYQFAGHTTVDQEISIAKTEQLLKSYTLTLTAPVAMSEELLASLQ